MVLISILPSVLRIQRNPFFLYFQFKKGGSVRRLGSVAVNLAPHKQHQFDRFFYCRPARCLTSCTEGLRCFLL
jgi:hypothetical protein